MWRRKYLIRVLIFAVLLLPVYGAWWLYELGKVRGSVELLELRTQHADLEGQYKKIAADYERVRRRIAALERASQIDRTAAYDIKAEQLSLQKELSAAREEIEFYRGIVSPGKVKPGLRIHRFVLETDVEGGVIPFDLVLTQLKKNDRYVEGTVDWSIVGTQGNKPVVLNLAAVTIPQTEHLKFRFRYFQHLAGIITLPEDFTAREVVLHVKPTGKYQPAPVQQTFAWPASES